MIKKPKVRGQILADLKGRPKGQKLRFTGSYKLKFAFVHELPHVLVNSQNSSQSVKGLHNCQILLFLLIMRIMSLEGRTSILFQF